MYAITTNWTRSNIGGKRECTVYRILTERKDMNHGPRIDNITDGIAERYKFKQNKRGNIVIQCGSGTGYMMISALMKADDKHAIVLDTSIF